MKKDLVKLAIIGLAAGTCVSGKLPIANANTKAIAETEADRGSGYCSAVDEGGDDGYGGYGQGSQGCGGRDTCANQDGPAGQGPSGNGNQNSNGNQKGSCSNKQGCSGMKTKKPTSKNIPSETMKVKRKSAAARVVEGR